MGRLLRNFLATLLLAGCVASTASAADRVYWTNEPADKISFANLDGSGGGDIPISGVQMSNPQGLAIDAAASRIYWANYDGISGNQIVSANLDGSGGALLNTAGATVDSPYGVAIDPPGGRVFWSNAPAAVGSIGYARLDGSGGGTVNTFGAAELDNPLGIAVDPAANRIYWANYGDSNLSYANLDGSGGGSDIVTTGATVSLPLGIAVDSAAGRVYWANYGVDKISYANLDGTGGNDLNTAGATVDNPAGVAVDPIAGRVYWANDQGKIGYANLNGTGGGDVPTTGVPTDEASFPALLKAPAAAGAPVVTVAPSRGSALTCSTGAWAPDLLGSFLYRAPHSFAYSWTLDGAPVPGAGAKNHTPTAVGSYRCTVAASNAAGATSQTSDPVTIEAAALGRLALRPRKFTAASSGRALATGSRKKRFGTRVSFDLNEGASVVLRVKQRRRSRSGKGKRLVTLPGRITWDGLRGANSFHFTGRLRGKRLKPGRYLLAATPTGVGKAGRTRSVGFTVREAP